MKSLLKCDVQKVYKINISRKTIKKLQNIAQFLCAQIFSTFFFNLKPIAAGDFILEAVGGLEFQPVFAGAC